MLDVQWSYFSQGLFRMESRLEKFKSFAISPSSNVVQFVRICGMGGSGKTTFASAYYQQNFDKFDGSSFLSNVRKTREQTNGLEYLQWQLLSDILRDKNIEINDVSKRKEMIRRRLCCKIVLIILDDVYKLDQLEALVD